MNSDDPVHAENPRAPVATPAGVPPPGPDTANPQPSTVTLAANPDILTPDAARPRPEMLHPGDQLSIPGFELLEVLGRGGMGVVYRARQLSLNRICAIKVISAGPLATEADWRRFQREAEVVAELIHPDVVQVFANGVAQGRPWMAFEYCAGGSLKDWLQRQGPQSAQQAAERLLGAIRGVAAAHSLGIVHRDLKPGNLLLTESGMTKVADFGLAKRFTTPGDLTLSQTILGTPEYLAPEMARGAKYAGPSVDVYALGVMLYQFVTGQVPHPMGQRTMLDYIIWIQSTPVPSLKSRQRIVPKSYQRILDRCLAKNPGERYADAHELLADLEAFLRNESLPGDPVFRGRQGSPMTRGLGAFAAGATCAGLVGLLGWFVLRPPQPTIATVSQPIPVSVLTSPPKVAVPPPRLAPEDLVTARRDYAKLVPLARAAFLAGQPERAQELLATTAPELRGWEYDYLTRAKPDQAFQLKRFAGHTAPINTMAVRPDGQRFITAGDDKMTRLWDVPRQEQIVVWQEHRGAVFAADFSRNGQRLATGSADGSAIVRDASTGKILWLVEGLTRPVTRVRLDERGQRLALISWNMIRLDAVDDRRTLSSLPDGSIDRVPLDTSFALAAGRLAVVGYPSYAALWDTETIQRVQGVANLWGEANASTLTPDGQGLLVASQGQGRKLNYLDWSTGRIRHDYVGHDETLRALAVSPDGRRFLSCGSRMVVLWDLAGAHELLRWSSTDFLPGYDFLHAEFAPDGRTIFLMGIESRDRLTSCLVTLSAPIIPASDATVGPDLGPP